MLQKTGNLTAKMRGMSDPKNEEEAETEEKRPTTGSNAKNNKSSHTTMTNDWPYPYNRETRGRTRSMYITLDYQVESVRPAVCVSWSRLVFEPLLEHHAAVPDATGRHVALGTTAADDLSLHYPACLALQQVPLYSMDASVRGCQHFLFDWARRVSYLRLVGDRRFRLSEARHLQTPVAGRHWSQQLRCDLFRLCRRQHIRTSSRRRRLLRGTTSCVSCRCSSHSDVATLWSGWASRHVRTPWSRALGTQTLQSTTINRIKQHW